MKVESCKKGKSLSWVDKAGDKNINTQYSDSDIFKSSSHV